MPGEERAKQHEEQRHGKRHRSPLPPQATGKIDDGGMEDIDAIGKVSNLPEPVQERKRECREIDDDRHRKRTEEVHKIAISHQHEDGWKYHIPLIPT